MSQNMDFDNVILRLRGEEAVITSVVPGRGAAFWPDLKAVAQDLALPGGVAEALGQRDAQEVFLSALSEKLPQVGCFRPARIGFPERVEDVRATDEYRASCLMVGVLGCGPRQGAIAALGCLAPRLRPKGRVEIQFRGWDLFEDWDTGRHCVADLLTYVLQTMRCQPSLTCFSNLRRVPQDFWEFIYDRPRVHMGWIARDLAGLASMEDFEAYRRESESFRNLEVLGEQGAYVHVVLPVTAVNVRILAEVVQALTEATRGGIIELDTHAAVRNDRAARRPQGEKLKAEIVKAENADGATVERTGGEAAGPPAVEDCVAAVMDIYRNPRIPLHRVAPLSWAAERIDAGSPLPSAPEAAGAAIAVLENGDLYPGEAFVGLEEWRLGNVLDDPERIRWERLDAVPEAFGNHSKPATCQVCDWRYRCGGVDCATQVEIEKLKAEIRKAEMGEAGSGKREGDRLFALYCAPRKALFEEMLWDSLTAAAAEGHGKRSRELIELHETSIDFKPAGTWCQKS